MLLACVTLILALLNSVVELGLLITIFAKQEAPVNATELTGIVSQATHVLAFLVLLCSITKFVFNIKKMKGLNSKMHIVSIYFPLIAVAIILFIIIYGMIIVTPPLIHTLWLENIVSNLTSNALISYSFTGTIYVTHISSGIIRVYYGYCNTDRHSCLVVS